MVEINEGQNYIFIVGAPRSGTTLLGEILGKHLSITEWYEPYFIWDWYNGNGKNDIRTEKSATEKTKNFIRKEFSIFLNKAKKEYLVDKSPLHSLQIPYVNKVFPKAKWIHIIRDGRASTLSTHREWLKRESIVKDKNLILFLKRFKYILKKQPFIRNKIQLLSFEFFQNSLSNPFSYLNKSKWNGRVGWGVRFDDWGSALNKYSLLEFNALQWLTCLEHILNTRDLINPNNYLEIYYEELTMNPKVTLQKVTNFLGVKNLSEDIYARINSSSINKWRQVLSEEQITKIEAIMAPMLKFLDYDLS